MIPEPRSRRGAPLRRRPLLAAAPRLVAALLPVAAAARPRPARAHALVVAAEPAAGARLARPPARVSLRFNTRIDRERSRLALVGPDGAQTALRPLPSEDPVALEADCPPEAVPWVPGAWRLRWQVLALDGHITRGDVPFTIAAVP